MLGEYNIIIRVIVAGKYNVVQLQRMLYTLMEKVRLPKGTCKVCG